MFGGHSSTKNLQSVTAVIELGAGLALLFWPSASVKLLVGTPLDSPAGWTVARIGGAGLLALGVACWIARGDNQSRAARGLITAMLVYNLAVVVLLAAAGVGWGLSGVLLWPAVAIHSTMTVWCTMCLLTSSSQREGSEGLSQ